MTQNDEIFQFIRNTQERLNNPDRQAAMRAAQTEPTAQNQGQIQDLKLDQIVSDVFVVSPAQLELIIEYTAKSLAIGLNVKTMYPKILRLTDKALKEAMNKSKRLGAKRK
ncbi:MAG: hypothetical protein LBH81_03775 [Rickettsiales bacterium]|jgi:hypothetical protein|nr:hypothetical protein [Rickettsiales bacterium]